MRARAVLALVMLALSGVACTGTVADDSIATTTTSSTVAEPTTTAATTTTRSETDAGERIADNGFAGPVAPAGIGDGYFPELGNPGYDVSHYTLDLVFDPDNIRLDGVATVTATAHQTLQTFNLDFTGLEVAAVTVDGVAAPFAAANEDLVVSPVTPVVRGEDFTVEVEYGGTPTASPSAAVPFGIGWQTVDGQNYVVAEPDAAHSWFPSNDHPLDKATFTFRLTLPDGVLGAANGVLVDRITDLGQTTWIWEMAAPMAPYLATVVIGDFELVEDPDATAVAGIPIRHVLPAGTTVADWPGLERQGEMMVFLDDLFGPYPFATYGIAIVDGFGAALENQTLSLFDSNLAESAFFEYVLIHELAHQWFGDSVSPGQWKDIWLNEGFASYAEWLWTERESGRAVLEEGIVTEREEFDGAGFNPPGSPPSFDLFNASVYRVGAMALHALRLTVGDDVFFEILRTYAARFADATAVTADFIAVAEEVSEEDLSGLFEDWLYDREVPEFPAR